MVESADHACSDGWRKRRFLLTHPGLLPRERTLEIEAPVDLAPDEELIWGTAVCTILGPFADFLEASIEFRGTVDASLAETHRLWAKAYQRLHGRPGLVGLKPSRYEKFHPPSGRLVASTFTGGIDSWFTLLTHNEDGCSPRIGAALFIHGLDSDHRSTEVREGLETRLGSLARAMGVQPMFLATNFRRDFARVSWSHRSHGACIAGMAMLLSERIHTLLLPSSAPLDALRPWGFHPLTDQRASNGLLRVEQDGWEYARYEKTVRVARSDAALAGLRVCYTKDGLRNCGRCEKCIRTKIQLAIEGALDRCPSLGPLDLKTVARMSLPEDWQPDTYEELRRLCAERNDLREVARAIGHAVRWRWFNVGVRRLLGRPV
ncbi:MAG: hypothetical protein N2109_10230 [Fimbriimonadales bacterium]|nr:hypothetical protein [Fimbriimonadales bacterium]